MLTPLDIENKKFTKSIKGYNVDDVDDFLDEVTVEYEKLYKENAELKNQIETMQNDLKHFRSVEHTLQNTLVMAQTTADNMIKDAQKSAEEIKSIAQKQADQTLAEAQSKAKSAVEDLDRKEFELKVKIEETKKNFEMYKSKMEMLLVSQLDLLKDMNNEE